MFFLTGMLNHVKPVRAFAASIGARASIDPVDMSLEMKFGGATVRFFPQFTYMRDGRRLYTPTFSTDVIALVGWRPYAARTWPATQDKRLFKELAVKAGVRVPGFWSEASDDVRHFVIKQDRSSFGIGIRGPFEKIQADNPHHRLADGEYYESFVPGRIAKAWYLGGELICAELRPPPHVTGDGRATLLELVARRRPTPVDAQALAWVLAAQGFSPTDVPDKGRNVAIEFRYGSLYEPIRFDNENVLSVLKGTPIGDQLARAGELLLDAIPAESQDTLITLDAVVDGSDQVWFLEMNSNPMVHPDCYPAIFARAFAPPHADAMESQAAAS